MPKISDERRAARREQIVTAMMRCVEREGFHKTTMAAVIQESGLSVGAVYRYFKGKDDLIREIARTAVGGVADTVAEMATAEVTPTLPDAVEAAVRKIVGLGERYGVKLYRVGLQSWAETIRDPEVLAAVSVEAQRIEEAWTRYAERAIEAGQLAHDADAGHVGKAITALLAGYMVHQILRGDIPPDQYAACVADMLSRAEDSRLSA